MAERSPLGHDPFAALSGSASVSASTQAKPAKKRPLPPKVKAVTDKTTAPAKSAKKQTKSPAVKKVASKAAVSGGTATSLQSSVASGLRKGSESRAELENLSAAMDGYRVQWESLMRKLEKLPEPDRRGRQTGQLLSRMEAVGSYFRPRRYLDFWFEFILASRSEEIDPFGLDPKFEARVENLLSFLYYSWWRVNVQGVNNIPDSGRALLVSNHSGVVPYDGAMIKLAVKFEHAKQRRVRFLVENFVFYFPFLGPFMYRFGSVRASQENARKLLNRDDLVAVFPEGVKGLGKLYRQRYQLQRFGRGGFIRLAAGTQSPIVPVAVIGAEEIHPVVARADALASILGVPYIPITFTFPALGIFGLIPLPTRWTIRFGQRYDLPEGSDRLEDIWVNEQALAVRKQIEQLIYDSLRERHSVFLG